MSQSRSILPLISVRPVPTSKTPCVAMYSVFNINVPLAVRFTTVPIGTRKAESSEYRRFDSDLH